MHNTWSLELPSLMLITPVYFLVTMSAMKKVCLKFDKIKQTLFHLQKLAFCGLNSCSASSVPLSEARNGQQSTLHHQRHISSCCCTSFLMLFDHILLCSSGCLQRGWVGGSPTMISACIMWQQTICLSHWVMAGQLRAQRRACDFGCFPAVM